ncbi:MAG: LmeA family phospholipid-binding protein [Actinomycetota bacterium]
MGKVLLVLAILAAVLVGGDLVIGSVAEARLAERVQNRLGLAERPRVDLKGFPFVLHALRRRFPEVSVEARDVRVQGLAIDRFVLRLRDVRFGSTASIAGGDGTLSAGGGRGSVEVSQASLGAFLERHDVPLRVELLGSSRTRVSGVATVLGAEVEASAEGELALNDGSLEFRPERVEVGDGIEVPASALAFRVELPAPVRGMVYEGITVERARAVLSFRVRAADVPL